MLRTALHATASALGFAAGVAIIIYCLNSQTGLIRIVGVVIGWAGATLFLYAARDLVSRVGGAWGKPRG